MIDLKKLKDLLLTRQRELAHITEASGDARKPVELDQSKVGRLSRMDAMQDQAMALEVENRRRVEMMRIEAALKRIDDGEYGFCASCGEDIERKRLSIDPATPLCQVCTQSGDR